MDVTVLALVLVGLAWAAHFFNKQRKWTKAVNLIPGPPAAYVIGNAWDLIWKYKFNRTKAFAEWTKEYGGIFRLWLGNNKVVVILSKPEDLEILLSSNKHIEKAEVYKQVQSWIGEGLLTSTGQKWHTRRKLITPTFHFRILDQFVEVFNRNSDILVQKLLAQKEAVNVHAFITLCTLDIICETAMGTKVEAQKNATSVYVSAVHNATKSFHMRTMKPWLMSDLVFNASSDGKTYNKALEVMHNYTKKVIENRRKEREMRRNSLSVADKDLGMKKKVAFLDQLLEANDMLLDKDIQEEVDTFMFEGHDTTAAALSFILYNVAANPEVQTRLAEEMHDLFGDSTRPATSQDLQNMRYTERVIKESLRLYPSVPLFGRIVKEDLQLTGGYVVPAGASVTVGCLQMGRDPVQWPDPERFDPDRFLPENTAGRHPYAYVPFSAGPRNCIGQKFAMMEMKSTISKVIRSCKVDLPFPDYKPDVEGMIILKAKTGVLLKISPR